MVEHGVEHWVVAPVAHGHAGRPVKLRGEKGNTGLSDKTIVMPNLLFRMILIPLSWFKERDMKRLGLTVGISLMLTGCTTTSCLTNLQPWPDPSGKHINLQQCWDKSDQIQFYTTNQGGRIAPYELIKHLEMPLSTDKFFARSNFERWRFLPLEKTDRDHRSDVDQEVQDWPLGFVITHTDSKKEVWGGTGWA